MGTRKFFLFGEPIDIDENLQTYTLVSQKFSEKRDRCLSGIRSMVETDASPDEIVRIAYNNYINQDASEIIKEISTYGIYTMTISDFARQDALKWHLDTYKSNIKQAEYVAEEIEQKALQYADEYTDNMVSGLPFGIISNSVIGLGVYAAQDYSERKKQAKEAGKTYRQMERNARYAKSASITAASEQAKEKFIRTCVASVSNIYDTMANAYLKTLEKCGRYNSNCLAGISVKRSSELLKNLNIVNEKDRVLLSSIKLCPYNPLPYAHAGIFGMIDENMIHMIDYLHINNRVIRSIESIDKLSKKTEKMPSEICRNHELAFHAIALLSGESESDVIRRYYPEIKSNVLEPYKELYESSQKTGVNQRYDDFIERYKEELQIYAQSKNSRQFVDKCVRFHESEINTLFTKFGEKQILHEIASTVGYQGAKDNLQYNEILNSFSESIAPVLTSASEELVRQQQQEIERQIQDEKKQKERIEQLEKKEKNLKFLKKLWKWSLIISALIFFPVGFLLDDKTPQAVAFISLVAGIVFLIDAAIGFLNYYCGWWDYFD